MANDSENLIDHNRHGYDAWGKSYDTDPNSTVFADEHAFPSFWPSLAGKKVFEIGCGTGRHTTKLVALGADVTALDLSAGMLAVARAKPPLAHVRFLEGDVYRVTPPDAAYDVVIAALVLEHLPDLPSFFARVAGWLSKGGRAYFSEIHPSRMQAGSGARFRGKDGEEIWLASMAHREDDFRAAIAAAGLNVLTKEDVGATPELLRQRPEWEKYRGRPMLQIWSLGK